MIRIAKNFYEKIHSDSKKNLSLIIFTIFLILIIFDKVRKQYKNKYNEIACTINRPSLLHLLLFVKYFSKHQFLHSTKVRYFYFVLFSLYHEYVPIYF